MFPFDDVIMLKKNKKIGSCGWMKSFSFFLTGLIWPLMHNSWHDQMERVTWATAELWWSLDIVLPRHCNLLNGILAVDGFYQHLIIRRVKLTEEQGRPIHIIVLATAYPKKYAHGFCCAVLCCGYTLTDFPISIRLTSLALWQSNDCLSASKATLMNMDKYFMWIHYER